MSWAEPSWLSALLLVAVLAVIVVLMGRRHGQVLAEVFGGDLLDRVWPRRVRIRRVVRDVALVLGLTGLVVALAEPRFGKQLRDVEARGVDIVLAVDLSRSMDAKDVDPSRLERARREIIDLIELLEGDRVGLVIYAGGAYPRMPLTLDYKALRTLVRELDTTTFEFQGSALDEALRVGTELLTQSAGEASAAILVLSDGEVHQPAAAIAAAEQVAAAGITVFGLVIGQEPAPIPRGDGGWLTDPSTGSKVMTSPSTDTLSQIARMTGGAVVQSVASNQDMGRLYTEEIRGRLRAQSNRSQQRETWTSAFQWPLGAGLGFLLLSAWIGDGRRRGLLLAALLVLPMAAQAQSVRDADQLYRDGAFDEAAEVLTELSLEFPDDADLFNRLGAARYRAGDFEGSGRAFQRAAELGDDGADFNAGNAYYRSGQFDRAIQQYDRVLENQPDHPGAQGNKQMVVQEMQQRRQEQQQRQQQQQQQQGGEQQEPQEGQQQESSSQQQQGEEGQEQQQQSGDPSEQQDSEQQQQQQQQGEPQGQPGQQQEEPPDGQQGQEASEETEEGDAQVDLEETLGEGEETEEASEGSASGDGAVDGQSAEDMSEAQAERVLEGVEEGRPRVRIPGRPGDKPW